MKKLGGASADGAMLGTGTARPMIWPIQLAALIATAQVSWVLQQRRKMAEDLPYIGAKLG
jgi:hypothetical protein